MFLSSTRSSECTKDSRKAMILAAVFILLSLLAVIVFACRQKDPAETTS